MHMIIIGVFLYTHKETTMPVTTTQKQQLTAATIAMFGVPMGGYSAWLQGQLEAANGNLQTVLDQLANIDYFKSIYSGDNATVATKLAATYGFTSVTGGLGQSVKTLFQNSLDAGASVAALINTANNFLLTNTDPTYADARNLLLNKVAVATFYTDNMQGNSQDLGALSKVLAGVGVSQDTVLTAQQQLLLALGSNGLYNTTIKSLTSGADNVVGTNDKDAIDGLTGDDTIQGGDGADHLLGSGGHDKLYGDRGADWLEGGTGNDRLEAGAYSSGGYVNGKYVTTYEATTNVLQGGDGADTLIGGYGADVLDGGTGADLIYGDEYTFYTDGMSADQLAGLLNDTIYGGDGADTIDGGGGQDWIDAGTGADRINMPKGGGYANGGEGDDRIYAYEGNDTIMGGAGNDDISYLSYGTTGNDLLDGGEGDDTISATGKSSNTVTIVGGTGNDRILISTVDGKANVTLGEGTDSVELGKGLYTIDLSETTQMTDTVNVSSLYAGQTDTTTISTVKGFSPAADRVDVNRFNLWGNSIYSGVWAGYGLLSDNIVTANYVQTISSPSTPLQGPSGVSYTFINNKIVYNPDYAGKGIFVITGASASAADSATVAQFLNPYGNNATYVTGSTYYFVVDVVGQGAALYMFKDDSNGDNNIVGDELSPIVLLTGVNAADLSYLNFI
jgi:Ca2+-binding RTX toxin-like protein